MPSPPPDRAPAHLPAAIARATAGGRWTRLARGGSGASLYRVDVPGGARCAKRQPAADSMAEAARLRWLAGTGLRCPALHADAAGRRHGWLLSDWLAGTALADLAPAARITHHAAVLRALHALDPASCPFDARLDLRLAEAGARAAAGRVDSADFDAARQGQPVAALLADLHARRPAHEDLVVTHGDACADNFIVMPDGGIACIDLGRLGVADRHQDLALAVRDIHADLGADAAARFLAAYGGAIDAARLDYYALLDEFF